MMEKLNITAIIQARMGSNRLPGKVLLDIGGKPMLAWVVERTRQAESVDRVVVATTHDPEDQPVVDYCREAGIDCARGDVHDVLNRYYQAALDWGADVVVRITGDCPFIDPGLIDLTVKSFLDSCPDCDFAANRLPPPWKRTYPLGLDTEVCSFQALKQAWEEAEALHQREHVMPYLYENQDRFNVVLLHHPEDYGEMRWTVDTADDLRLAREIAAHFKGREDFTWLEILELMKREPRLAEINADVHHKSLHDIDPRMRDS